MTKNILKSDLILMTVINPLLRQIQSVGCDVNTGMDGRIEIQKRGRSYKWLENQEKVDYVNVGNERKFGYRS